MDRNSGYIGVFDSGIGGISILRQLRKVLPKERYFYFGDSANAPYGTRPEEEIRELTLAAAEKVMTQGVKALVIACNTATSAAMDVLRAQYPGLIIQGTEPAVAMAVRQFPGGHIGVMATPATLKGSRFLRNKAQYEAFCRITPLPAPGLMDLVEAGKGDSPEADALLHEILDPCKAELDGLVLGCTHYPFAEAAIRRVLGTDAVLFDGAEVTAVQTKKDLEQAELLFDGPGEVVFRNSIPGESMLALSRQLAGME